MAQYSEVRIARNDQDQATEPPASLTGKLTQGKHAFAGLPAVGKSKTYFLKNFEC